MIECTSAKMLVRLKNMMKSRCFLHIKRLNVKKITGTLKNED